jgi:hypothetical protein
LVNPRPSGTDELQVSGELELPAELKIPSGDAGTEADELSHISGEEGAETGCEEEPDAVLAVSSFWETFFGSPDTSAEIASSEKRLTISY